MHENQINAFWEGTIVKLLNEKTRGGTTWRSRSLKPASITGRRYGGLVSVLLFPSTRMSFPSGNKAFIAPIYLQPPVPSPPPFFPLSVATLCDLSIFRHSINLFYF